MNHEQSALDAGKIQSAELSCIQKYIVNIVNFSKNNNKKKFKVPGVYSTYFSSFSVKQLKNGSKFIS